jgi:hypothetical protein
MTDERKRNNVKRVLLLALACAFILAGCTTYYTITDPATDKVHYTTEYDKDPGGATFTDSKTGAEMTIQNPEIKEVSRKTYSQGIVNDD